MTAGETVGVKACSESNTLAARTAAQLQGHDETETGAEGKAQLTDTMTNMGARNAQISPFSTDSQQLQQKSKTNNSHWLLQYEIRTRRFVRVLFLQDSRCREAR